MEVVAITSAAATTLELMLEVVAEVVLVTLTRPFEFKLTVEDEGCVEDVICTDDLKLTTTLPAAFWVEVLMLTRLESPSVTPMFEVLGDVLLVTDAVCLGVTVTDDVLFAVEADTAADDLLDVEIEEVAPLVVEVICAVDFKAPERLPVAFAVLLDTDVLALLETAIEAVVGAVEAAAETVALDDTETDDVLAAVEELTEAELLIDNEADDVA